ncbi:alpha-galactosidase [Paenibacillus harenae]|nr:alpha-galactosidase [Paenibacillus harenae]
MLDDGWFGRRDSDNTSLGDWVEDRRKLPSGLRDLAERITRRGLKFGLWFEPEMISPDSYLYRAHPDWCLHVAGRRRTEARWQLVLIFRVRRFGIICTIPLPEFSRMFLSLTSSGI